MSDLNSDLRLAVDTGSVSIGTKETLKAINGSTAKVVIISSKGKPEAIADIVHVCGIAGIKVIKFEGKAVELGTVCGKPYPINSIAIIDAGHSRILEETY